MKKAKQKLIIWLVILVLLLALIITGWTVMYFYSFAEDDFDLGVNYSNAYATYLGLNWQETYTAILDDLNVTHIRVAAPWNEIEPQKGVWNFAALDWQIAEAEKRGVEIILVIGRRTPHWPECHDPKWIMRLDPAAVENYQMRMLEKVVLRYQGKENIKIWQVENEPLLNAFGVCPPADSELLRREVALVKSLDDRQVLITDSGELSLWRQASSIGDLFGSTLYRVTYNPLMGYSFYHFPPAMYRVKAWLVGKDKSDVIISELQAEPWAPKGILNTSIDEQKISMDARRMRIHVNYAKRTGFAGAYLWGAEWWYWLKSTKDDDSLWQEAESLFIREFKMNQ